MRKIFICLSLILIGLGNLSLHAWWDEGHMAVAKIAYDRLEPVQRKKADELVEIFSNFFPSSSTFITASCWPDDIRDYGITAFASWHYSSIPYAPNGFLSSEEKQQILIFFEGRDIVFSIQDCLKTLQNPTASVWSKGLMLRFLIHFVGDIHQPLHCCALYNPQFPEGDRGGNLFLIPWAGHEKGNLHSFWDSMCGLGVIKWPRPLDENGKKAITDFTARITQAFPESSFSEDQLDNVDIYHWREESALLAEVHVYQGIYPQQSPSAAYIANGQQVASSQVALAGYRLARLLNKILNAS